MQCWNDPHPLCQGQEMTAKGLRLVIEPELQSQERLPTGYQPITGASAQAVENEPTGLQSLSFDCMLDLLQHRSLVRLTLCRGSVLGIKGGRYTAFERGEEAMRLALESTPVRLTLHC